VSATIYWQPVNGTVLDTGTPTYTLDAMEKAFGTREPELTAPDIPTLRGLSAAWNYPGVDPWQELIEAVRKHNIVKVRVTF
jgi:hypothetical protein